jgi:hypothetical protein
MTDDCNEMAGDGVKDIKKTSKKEGKRQQYTIGDRIHLAYQYTRM